MAWTEADFQNAYSIVDRNPASPSFGARVSYGLAYYDTVENFWANTIYAARVTMLHNQFQFSANSKVLIVGCGFGYLNKSLTDYVQIINPSWDGAWGADNSAYIQANKATESPNAAIAAKVLNLDVTAGNILTLLKPYTGGNGKVDFVITEDVIDAIPSSEWAGFLSACDGLIGQSGEVAHIITSELTPVGEGDVHDRDTGLTWQSHAAWAALNPSHWWMDNHNQGVWLGGV